VARDSCPNGGHPMRSNNNSAIGHAITRSEIFGMRYMYRLATARMTT